MQDGISKHLGQAYPAVFITMIRYWAFVGFSVLLASRLRGGIRATARTKTPWLQVTRGALLSIEIVMAITCFAIIGLARTQAIFAATPLIATLLSILVLGERAGLIRWLAVVLGFAGVLVVIRPSGDYFDPVVLLAVLTSLMFAVYIVLTRLVSRVDAPLTSFFYTGVAGCVTISLIGPFFWTNLPPGDWAWMLLLCLTSVSSHYFLIKAYDILHASAVQPLTYLSVVDAFVQHAAIAALEGPRDEGERMRQTYQARRDLVLAGLRAIPGVKVGDIPATFYAFPDVSEFLGRKAGNHVMDSTDHLCDWLLEEHGVATVPGIAFGAPGSIRLSFAASEADLEKAMTRLHAALTALR